MSRWPQIVVCFGLLMTVLWIATLIYGIGIAVGALF
jgi:hypothetical protein